MRTAFVLLGLGSIFLLPFLPAQNVSQNFAFVDVNVIDMKSGNIMPHQTVTVHKNRITAVANNSKVDVDPSTISIDGHDMYLMPGLVDMHVHAHSSQDLSMFVAKGVTTVRNMRGSPTHLAFRNMIAEEKLLGPTLYTCGPILDGAPPTGESVIPVETEEEASQIVAEQKSAGYDCIKVYTRLSRKVYRAIMKAAKENHIPVAGHVPSEVGLDLALVLGQNSIEHLTGYMGAIENDEIQHAPKAPKVIKESEIPLITDDTAKSKVWNCPTLVVQHNYATANEKQKAEKNPGIEYVAPVRLALWDPSRERRFQGADFRAVQRGVSMLKRIVRSLHDSKAGILLGTDAPSRFVVPGFSVHRELRNLVESGLSPFEALKTATLNPAIFLNAESEFGTVSPGKRADLILLKANPLEEISNSEKLAGVMLRGRWFPEPKLNEILKEIKNSFEPASNRFSSITDLPEDGVKLKYEILTAGVVMGEERFVQRDAGNGNIEILSQQVNDPPFSSTYSTRLVQKANGSVLKFELNADRPEGKTFVEMYDDDGALRTSAQMPFQNTRFFVEDRIGNFAKLEFTMASSRAAMLRMFPQINVGATAESEIREIDFFTIFNKGFQVHRTQWKIRREQDTTYSEIPARVYVIDSERKHFKHSMKLLVDSSGFPLTIQRGPTFYRRIFN